MSMIASRALSPRQFALVLNTVRSAYLDEVGRGGLSRVYRRLVDLADVAGLKQDGNGWWTAGEANRDTRIMICVEEAKDGTTR